MSFHRRLRTISPSSAQQFDGQPGVLKVSYAQQEIANLLHQFNRWRWVGTVVAILVMFGAVALIINTIQLGDIRPPREVAVMKLVGATNWFIRVPFMLEGLVHGLAGAVVAMAVTYFVRNGIASLLPNQQFLGTSQLYVTPHEALMTGLLLLVVGAVVGVLGSVLRGSPLPGGLTALGKDATGPARSSTAATSPGRSKVRKCRSAGTTPGGSWDRLGQEGDRRGYQVVGVAVQQDGGDPNRSEAPARVPSSPKRARCSIMKERRTLGPRARVVGLSVCTTSAERPGNRRGNDPEQPRTGEQSRDSEGGSRDDLTDYGSGEDPVVDPRRFQGRPTPPGPSRATAPGGTRHRYRDSAPQL